MKKIISLILAVVLMCSFAVITNASDDITVYLDGAEIQFDVKPQIIGGRTMVPIRAIFEKMGASVEWNSATATATAKRGTTTVVMAVGDTNMCVNNVCSAMDAAPAVINGRTLAPARYVAEAFGGTVAWNPQTRRVDITSSKPVTLYAPDGRTISVNSDEVQAYINVGWYTYYVNNPFLSSEIYRAYEEAYEFYVEWLYGTYYHAPDSYESIDWSKYDSWSVLPNCKISHPTINTKAKLESEVRKYFTEPEVSTYIKEMNAEDRADGLYIRPIMGVGDNGMEVSTYTVDKLDGKSCILTLNSICYFDSSMWISQILCTYENGRWRFAEYLNSPYKYNNNYYNPLKSNY